MRKLSLLMSAALLASCADEAPPPAAEAPAKLPAGEWEATATVTGLQGKAAAQSKTKVGDVQTARACVGADGAVPPALFAAKGETCQAQMPYIRDGKLNATLSCRRTGAATPAVADVRGTYTADSIAAESTVTRYTTGVQNYQVVQKVTGRRIGDCPSGAVANADAETKAG